MRSARRTLQWALGQIRRPGVPSRIARGAGIVFTLQVAGVLLAYGSQVLLARWLGTTEYGKFAYALSWATLLAVPAGLGLNTAVLRFIPQYRTKGESGFLRGMMRLSWRLTAGAGVLVALLGTAATLWFVGPEYEAALLVGVWMIPLLALVHLYTGMARTLRSVTVAFAPPLVLRPLLLVAGVFALLVARGDVNSQQVLAVAVVTLLAITLFQGLMVHRKVPREVKATKSRYRSGEWLKVGGPLLLGATFGMLITQSGVVMVGSLGSPADAGLYSAAAKTATFVSFVLLAVNALSAPTFVSLHSQGKREELQRLLYKSAHMIFWPSLAIAATLVVFSGFVLGLFGQEFVAARAAMVVLIAGQIVSAGAGAVGNLTDLTGYHWQGAWVRGVAAALNILVAALLIPAYGILGAAIASAASLILWNVWLHRMAVKNLGVKPSILFALSRPRASGT